MIRIPRTCESRGQHTFARLVTRVFPDRQLNFFEGPLFRCGQRIRDEQISPESDYPDVKLLIEYAGNDRTGWGHRRSNDIHVLWRWDPETREWVELLRTKGQGSEWVVPFKAAILGELGCSVPSAVDRAWDGARRVLSALDTELAAFEGSDRHHLMNFLHEEFLGRLVTYTGENDPVQSFDLHPGSDARLRDSAAG